MKLKLTALVLALSAGLGSVAQTAAAASAPYEFSYVNEQPPTSDLVQVFNDGTTTFFQFKRMPLNPKITIVRGGKEIAVNFEASPPYLMVPGIEAEYFVLVGESLSHVLYRGQRHEISKQGSEIDRAIAELEDKKRELEDKKLKAMKEEEARKLLDQQESQRIAEQKRREEQCKWKIDPIKTPTLRLAMEHWASMAGYQPMWETASDHPIEAKGEFCGSYETALQAMLEAFGSSDAPVAAVLWQGNKAAQFVSGAK